MHDNDIYTLTPRGQEELRGGATTLNPAEMELLIRVDGSQNLSQLRTGMTTDAPGMFTAAFMQLRDKGLVTLAEVDPFTEQFTARMTDFAVTQAESEADSGAASLKKAGYYVRIARPRGPARPRQPGETLSAIVVDDEPMLAKFIQSYLSFEGFHVRLASNRAEVVAEFRKQPAPDLILLDVMLPDADGFDILLRLRQHPALKDVPVIMLTGKATREAVLKGLAGGADGYVTKPFEADALMLVVRTVLGLPPEPKGPELSLL
ncbi:response regulator [Polaromonas sp.]|uniref:response regulator transcription factor n=1 Tax=Polaromonas sp. TaxID=1869339 RepID=UPI002486F2CB|nr:response regulator [Polaromonas sp.]MDI1273337.1 response regulator [Polaromonas sp.]